MSQVPDNRPHATVAVLGPSGHGKTSLRRRLAEQLAREHGARVRDRERDDRIRCELPGRTVELVDQPPADASTDDLIRAVHGADLVVFVVAPRRFDEDELARLARLARAFAGPPILWLNAREHDDHSSLDRAEFELRELLDRHAHDGDALPCLRSRAPRALEALAGRLLHDAPVTPPSSDTITAAEVLDAWREPEWHPDELGLSIYLSHGTFWVGDALTLARPFLVSEFIVTAIDFGASAPARVDAARHARVRARFVEGPPAPLDLPAFTLLDRWEASRRPWQQVFLVELSFFDDPPPYPKPPPLGVVELDRCPSYTLRLPGGRVAYARIFGVEGSTRGDGYAWRALAETDSPHIFAPGTRFVVTDDHERLLAMGVIRRALDQEPFHAFDLRDLPLPDDLPESRDFMGMITDENIDELFR